MAVNFKIPASPATQIYENDTFLGVDFTTDAGNVDDTRSPDAVNMIRSIPGKIRKRMGYKLATHAWKPIYGAHYYSFANIWILHAGNKLYQFKGGTETFWVDNQPAEGVTSNKIQTEDNYNILFQNLNYESLEGASALYTGIAENRSTAYELNQMLVILDGKKMVYVELTDDGTLVAGKMEDYPSITIPVVRISCTPDGAGTDYQPFNLLSPKFRQDFIIDNAHSNTTTLQLYTDKIGADPVKMEILQADGSWQKKIENTDFSVNRKTGVITFITSRTSYDIETVVSVSVETWKSFTERLSYSNVQYTIDNSAHGVNVKVTFPRPSYLYEIYMSVTITTTMAGETREFTESYHYYPQETVSSYQGFVDFEEDLVTRVTYHPPVTPVAGMDNIRVYASYIPTSGNADLINHCRFGCLFGINGASDRLFVSGNEYQGDDLDENGNKVGSYELKNRDWYSERYDPTYFPDIGYSVLGSDTSAIMGYAVVNSYLATFKDNNEPSQTVFIREGDMTVSDLDGDGNEETQPTFKLINTLQGAGAISSYCFAYLEVEPIFLSKLGIYSLTSQDITGEKYAQNRSYYLNNKLMKERNLDQAIGIVWKDYYVLCVNNRFYILDGLQPVRTDKSAPYAIRQYVSFYFEFNFPIDMVIPAGAGPEKITYIWEMYGMLYFGTSHGRVMRFYTDEKDMTSYNDNGHAIPARWQTPDISGKLFYKNKTFRYVGLRVTPARNSSVIIEAEKNGVWEEVKADYAKIKYFSFIDFTFARTVGNHPQFTFQCDKTQKVITTKTRIKKVDKVQFRFSNSEVNEPLGLNNFALEYTQGGNIK